MSRTDQETNHLRAQQLRQQAKMLLIQAGELDQRHPYSIIHVHEYGASVQTVFWGGKQGPSEQEAIGLLHSEFEPDRNESLYIEAMSHDDIIGSHTEADVTTQEHSWKVSLEMENGSNHDWQGVADNRDHAEGLAIAEATSKTNSQVASVVTVSTEITLKGLYKLWDQLADIPVSDDTEEIEEDFLQFSEGTHRETIWRWFESQNPRFLVGEVMQGIRHT